MQHGTRTRYHLIDETGTYHEEKWLRHHWTKRGHTRYSRYCHFWKREYRQAERRRGKDEVRRWDSDL